MKITATVCRYLLGLLFTVFGLNGFLHFIYQPPPVNPLARQFFAAMSASHFMAEVFLVQIIGGILLLAGFFITLSLAILSPVLANILNYHTTMDPGGIGIGLTTTIIWAIVFLRYRSCFIQILQRLPSEETAAKP